jgi:hypothetical protein
VGRRSRRAQAFPALKARPVDYADADGNVLTLRGSLTAGTRRQLARERAAGRAAATVDDSWQREVELLFERLAVSWVIAGVSVEGQGELLARFRVASSAERQWVRETLRTHCAELFPDVQAP